MNIKEIIKKHKAGKDPGSINWPELIEQITKDVIEKRLEGIKEELKPEVAKAVAEAAKEVLKEGMKGERGGPGPMGLRGFEGKQGKEGKPGKQGKPGLPGKAGEQGRQGLAGKNGSPDKPEMIARKLNTLEGALDPKVIKGYQLTMRNIFTSLREKNKEGGRSGGGMGNWVHQRFAIGSSTTAVSLSSNVAAAGMAHIVRYQGQVLDYGTHYTITGKTLTLVITPEDSTVLSIAYVRT